VAGLDVVTGWGTAADWALWALSKVLGWRGITGAPTVAMLSDEKKAERRRKKRSRG
jgi:hypothetical protein